MQMYTLFEKISENASISCGEFLLGYALNFIGSNIICCFHFLQALCTVGVNKEELKDS